MKSVSQWRQTAVDNPEAILDGLTKAQQRLLDHQHVVIHQVDIGAQVERLLSMDQSVDELPLFGVPFVIKDNIDLAGAPTTAACPGYTYQAAETAPAVQAALDAGAILLAKVNMDQFATGLVGTRSPYGTPANPRWPGRIPGGSSSGSAVAVAIDGAAFSLGTDTAGSGRVPAAANGLIGVKATRGYVSTRGVVPACRSLDCVSIFCTYLDDADLLLNIIGQYDAEDPFSRQAPAPQLLAEHARIGSLSAEELVIDEKSFADGYATAQAAFEAKGHTVTQIQYKDFAEAAQLLYGGPWVAERTAAVGEAIAAKIDGLDETVAGIIAGGSTQTATACFEASYKLAALRRRCEAVWQHIDVLMLPTVPGLPSIEDVNKEPVAINTRLGTYTNFVNLLDCCALTIPMDRDPRHGPASVTLVAPAWREAELLRCASALLPEDNHTTTTASPASPGTALIAVIGAHLRGQPLHHQLTERGARFIEQCQTAPLYRLFAFTNTTPAKPGLIRVADSLHRQSIHPQDDQADPKDSLHRQSIHAGSSTPEGQSIEAELYELPLSQWGSFVAGIPEPLGIGTLRLADGRSVHGFICEAAAAESAEDITEYRGWRAWLASQSM